MDNCEKQWFVMRDLKRRNANTLAIHDLANAGVEVFTPMTQMIMTIGGRRQRRYVPVIQDLLFAHESKVKLDSLVQKYPTLQFRYVFGKTKDKPMTVRKEEMERFIYAVSQTESPLYYKPGEITDTMCGNKVRIIGGVLNAYEGKLLSIKGMRKKRLIIKLEGLITAAVEVEPEFIQVIR